MEQFLIQIFVLLKFSEVPGPPPPPPPPPPFQNPAYATVYDLTLICLVYIFLVRYHTKD